MKWISSTGQMRAADRYMAEEMKVPGLILMEAAAGKVADKVEQMGGLNCRVLFLCGGGNNGGDGFAAARMLKSRGHNVRIFLASDPASYKGDAATNFAMLPGYQVSVLNMSQSAAFARLLEQAEVVVDALFGTGLDRPVEGFYKQIITVVNEAHRVYPFKTLAVDIPSGVQGDSGKILGCAIEADETITFSRLKPGLLLFPGRDCAGKVTVADIGIPENIPPLKESLEFQLEYSDLKNMLPVRKHRSHKGLYGHLLVVAGCRSMTGAAMFAAKSAYKVGAGLVEAAIPAQAAPVLMSRLPEVICTPYDTNDASFGWIDDKVVSSSCFVAGPGLGREPYVGKMLEHLFASVPADKPMVLDADALNWLSESEELHRLICERGGNTILTPHLGEASRLLKVSVGQIMDEPVEAAKALAHEFSSIAVLKDAMTVVAEPNGRIFFNWTGNNGMSTAGSGDVLAGMIGGLLGQRCDPFRAACLGVFMHGAAGDLAKEDVGEYGMCASDLVDHIYPEKMLEKA